MVPATERERQGRESKGLWLSNGNSDNFGAGVFFGCCVNRKMIVNTLPLCIKMCIVFFWLFYCSVNSITAAQTGQRKRSSMHGESLAIVYLCSYNKKGTNRPSTVLINISKINWWSSDFHSRQAPATVILLNRKLLLKEYFGPNPKGNMLAKGNMFQGGVM